MHPLQEKFQIITPGKEEAAEPWATFESARDLDGERATGDTQVILNPPPGMDIANQDSTEQNSMPFQLSGSSDVSKEMYSAEALGCGYSKLDMKGSDDMYTGEHVDHFYGDSGGFAERNNYLDRI
jgi:hypothetical protein